MRGPKPLSRFPIAPLLRAANAENYNVLARLVGVNHAVVRQLASRGGLSMWMADDWAIRCGLHPAMVWPDWLDVTESAPA